MAHTRSIKVVGLVDVGKSELDENCPLSGCHTYMEMYLPLLVLYFVQRIFSP